MTVNHMSSVLLFLPLACVDLGRVLCDKVRAHYDKIQQLLSLLLLGGMSKHHIHTHTHTHIYIHIYTFVLVGALL